MEEVARILRDPAAAQAIVDRAFEEIASNEAYSYAGMVGLVDRVMDEEWRDSLVPASRPYTHDEFDELVRRHVASRIAAGPGASGLKRAWRMLPQPLRSTLRPLLGRMLGI